MSKSPLFAISDQAAALPSPALLVDADRVAANIQQMIQIAPPERLQPHLKTHKMVEVLQLQQAAGIQRFKAATLAELEMAAAAGVDEVLLAMQPVGPQQARLLEAVARWPATRIMALVDEPGIVLQLAAGMAKGATLPLCIDVDCGMARSGIAAGAGLNALADLIDQTPGVQLDGFHLYDGHLHMSSYEDRRAGVSEIREQILPHLPQRQGQALLASGSPTFGLWAAKGDVRCCPGTPVFWDIGYAKAYEDLLFDIAAVLLTRVVSKPASNRLCLDLGHKAVAAENPIDQRVYFPALSDDRCIAHSEEHLVVETPHADRYEVGQTFIGFPHHICPSVALHARAHIIRDDRITNETWSVTARDR